MRGLSHLAAMGFHPKPWEFGVSHMKVSINGGSPKSSILMGFSHIKHPAIKGYLHDYGNPNKKKPWNSPRGPRARMSEIFPIVAFHYCKVKKVPPVTVGLNGYEGLL